MNENLNLVELLKDVPKGTKFHCLIFGDVTFDGICDSRSSFPIIFKTERGGEYSVTTEGKLYESFPNAECVFFPSKEQRDWGLWAKEQEEEKKQLPINTPVMCSSLGKQFYLMYYAKNSECFFGREEAYQATKTSCWNIIIPFDKFNPNDIEESLKHNIVKP